LRAIAGFVGFHLVLTVTGAVLLQALGLAPSGTSARRWGLAVGPALLLGIAVVMPILIVLLVLGVPLTAVTGVAVCLVCGGAARAVHVHRRARGRQAVPSGRTGRRVLTQLVAIVGGAYALVGAVVFARLPTVYDDSRIWSLRGLTLTYEHHLVASVIEQQAHPVYPLLQPVMEATLFGAMGGPQLRFFHTELWIVFGTGIWTAGYLIARSIPRASQRPPFWMAILGLLAITPAAVGNIVIGDADVTAAMLLALGTLSIGLWFELGTDGLLAFAAIALAAAANTKDEEFLASAIVLAVTALALIIARRPGSHRPARRGTALPFVCAVLYFGAIVAPWRIWVSAHHLTDTVTPPLPRALSPVYFLGRGNRLHQTAHAMLANALGQWGLFAALFICTVIVTLTSRHDRRLAIYYLACVTGVVLMLLWLYTTTTLSLAFLLPNGIYRTVDLFMIPAGLATAHLVARLTATPRT
jgi:hypothetical protein